MSNNVPSFFARAADHFDVFSEDDNLDDGLSGVDDFLEAAYEDLHSTDILDGDFAE